MTVYVGMDVHRKRSQVAIIDEAGDEQRNRNVPNDPAQLLPIPLRAAAGHAGRVPGRLQLGLAGRSARGAGTGTASGPSQPLQGDRRCQAEARQGRCPHAGAAAARRPAPRGLDRCPAGPRPARAAAPPGRPGARVDRGQQPHPRGAGRPGIQQQRGLWTGTGRVWLAELPLLATPRAIVETTWPCWTVWPNRSPAWTTRSPRVPRPTHGSRRCRRCPGLVGYPR
jgi:hypothetical protein